MNYLITAESYVDLDTGEVTFKATCSQYPDVVEYGDSYDEAIELMIDTVETLEKRNANG